MTNLQKAKEIGANWYNAKCCGVPMDSDRVAEQAALEMAEWKDEQINLLLDAIDYVFLKTDGTYGDLPLVVVDEVEYLKSLKYDKRR